MKILVAGATGALGREVTTELKRRGHFVRILTRSAKRADGLEAQPDHVHCGDVLSPASLKGVGAGMDAVVSCVGASVDMDFRRGWRGFSSVDGQGNRNLLEAVTATGRPRFVYVSVFGAPTLRRLQYMDAHEQVVDSLRGSGLAYAVLRPTGFFSAFRAILEMARKGRVPEIGTGEAKTNPICESDLARIAVDALEGKSDAEQDIGGPRVYTRHEINAAAFDALKRPARITRVPATALAMTSVLLRPLHPRLSHLVRCFLEVSSRDCIAPLHGSKTLEDAFKSWVSRSERD